MEWYWFAIFAAFLSGTAMIIQKKVLFKEHTVEYNTVTKFFQAALVLFLLPLLNLNYPWWIFLAVYVLSLFSTANIILETKAYRHLELSSVAPLGNISPVFLLVFAFLFLGEKVNHLQGAGILILVFGSYFLEAEHHWTDVKQIFNLFKLKYMNYFFIGLIIGVFLALVNKHFVNIGVDVLCLTFLYYVFNLVNFVIIIFLFYDGLGNIKHGIKNQGFPIFLIALFYVLNRLSYLKALTLGYVALVIPIMKSGVLLSTLVGGELFHEKHIFQRTVSCAIMILGACLIILG